MSSEILLSLGIGVVLYVQPFYYQAVGLSDQTIGTLFAINSASAGVTAVVLGSVADRLGASRVFKAATLLLPSGYLLTGLSHAFWPLAAGSALSGFGASLLLSTENVVLSSLLAGVEKSHVLSRFVAMYTLVMAVGTAISGFISQTLGYEHTLILGASVSLLAPAIRLFVRAPDTQSPHLFRRPSAQLLKMGIYAILFGCAAGLFTPFATLIIQGHYHISDKFTAIVSALALLFTSAGSYSVTPLIARFARNRTILYSFWAGICITIALAFGAPVAWSFILLFLIRTALFSVPGSIVDASFLEWTEPTMHVQMFGVRVFGSSIGSAVGSYAGGNLLNRNWIALMLILSALLFALSWLYLRTLLRRQRVRVE